MSTLNWLTNILCYDDTGSNTNNNPLVRVPDVAFQMLGMSVQNARAEHFKVPANSSLTLFSGVRTTNISATTVFSLTTTSVASTYRLISTGGTPPAFNTARVTGVDATTQFTISINNNALVTMTNSGGTAPTFGTVTAGDVVYIGSSTGFSSVNRGYFTVISTTSNSISFVNPLAVVETQVLNSSFATDFQIYAYTNVQIGDTVVISAGFSPVAFGSYTVTAVTPIFLEFMSSSPLPIQSSISPGAAGITIYSASKFFLYVQSDQNGLVWLNGDTSSTNCQIQPFGGYSGFFQKIGPTYQVLFKNQSITSVANILVFSAERV